MAASLGVAKPAQPARPEPAGSDAHWFVVCLNWHSSNLGFPASNSLYFQLLGIHFLVEFRHNLVCLHHRRLSCRCPKLGQGKARLRVCY